MTPYEITIVLHHSYSWDRFPRDEAPLYAPTVQKMIDDGILEKNDDGSIGATKRGEAFVDMLCNTPLPEMRWVDPRIDNIGRDT